MKAHNILASLCAIASLFLCGCGNGRLAAIKSVSIDGSGVVRPKRITFSNQASANVDSFASPGVDGILPMLVLGAIHKGVTAKPQREIETAISAHGIAIEKIVPPAFTTEMARGGLFTVVPQGGDATFRLQLLSYGIQHRGSAWRNSLLSPTVTLMARLVGSDGHEICKTLGVGTTVPGEWHTQEQFRDQPELMRVGFDTAARAATLAVIRQIRQKMPK